VIECADRARGAPPGGHRGDAGHLACRIRQRDIREQQPREVDQRQHQQQKQRDDEGEFDQRLCLAFARRKLQRTTIVVWPWTPIWGIASPKRSVRKPRSSETWPLAVIVAVAPGSALAARAEATEL